MMPTVFFATGTDPDSALARLHPGFKLAALLLALITCLAVPAWLLPAVLALPVGFLIRSGLPWRRLARAAYPWWPVALLVLGVHLVTTVEAAPLGRPSWTGLGQGVVALARVAGSAAWLALLLRVTPLAQLTAGLGWWWRPGRRLGLDTARLSLVLAVAFGTVPSVLAEGRRIDSVVRLRRGPVAPGGRRWRYWWRRALDPGYLVVPLVESLFRRAESLTLSVQGRLPRPPVQPGPLPAVQAAGLVVWAGMLVWNFC